MSCVSLKGIETLIKISVVLYFRDIRLGTVEYDTTTYNYQTFLRSHYFEQMETNYIPKGFEDTKTKKPF